MKPPVPTRRVAGQRGSSILEGALVFGAILSAVTAILDFGRIMHGYNMAPFLAREGARYACVRGGASGNQTTPAAVQSYVQSLAAGIAASDLAVNAAFTGYTPGSSVTVTITCTVRPIMKFILPGNLNIVSSAVMKISQ